MFFDYSHLRFRYEPFAIGLARPILEESTYRAFVDNFPPLDLFKSFGAMGKEGRKFTLSEKESPETYKSFVRSNPVWRDFHSWIKSSDFVYGLMDVLREHDIDLGFRYASPVKRRLKRLRHELRGKASNGKHDPLRARFEFSALPADGGSVPPHTDAPTKVATIVVSMLKDGEWNPDFGGGTDVNRPRDDHLRFNHMNRLAGFDDMEVVDSFDYAPNQGVIFAKTFNSWHSVRPLTGQGSAATRNTLTVTVERLA
jgi:hypothetical protein